MSDNDMTADDYKDRNFRDDVKAVEVSSEEATLDEAYKKVYMHLKCQDIKPMVEKKKVSNSFQPDFLSWTHVWEFLLQTYPDFTLEYLDPITYDDGTMTVQCRLSIYTHAETCPETKNVTKHRLVRTERLYVMDNKMNAVRNPNAQQINKTEKRCFVKCAALFGLGIQLFTGEDLPDVDAVEPEPKAAPKKKQPEAPKKDEDQPWEGDPKVYLDMILGWAEESFKTRKTSDSVREIWRANKKGIDKLEKEYPEIFKQMKEEFTQLAEKAEEEEAKDGNEEIRPEDQG
tara:strand:+ start:3056 stop:3916 length:861 start_codon:yes stop_codon:yes gene_type:complete